jgi:catechol 2,3-dioxygenase-like lactoylglutathione lyase family enzyme
MPVLDHFKKQAKLYLRWHQQGYFPVAAQIRLVLDRYAGLSDKEILARAFKLGDAQELVARKAGFESWGALRQGTADMTTKAIDDRAATTLMHAEPQLFVADLDAAFGFYVGKLGFEIGFAHGEPPFYAQVHRDGARLNLRRVSRPAFDRAFLESEDHPLAATIAVDDAKPLFLEYEQAGVDFRQRLRTEPWGARTFIVADPDGNLICFAGLAA